MKKIIFIFMISSLLQIWSCNNSNLPGVGFQKPEKDLILEHVDVIQESCASYYTYFKTNSNLYSVTKHKDEDIYRVYVTKWDSKANKIYYENQKYRLFEDSISLNKYIKNIDEEIIESNKNIFNGVLPTELIKLLPKDFEIIQQSKVKGLGFFLVLRNNEYELKVVYYNVYNKFYKELISREKPHLIELSFIDINNDGIEDVIIREFFLYDKFDIYIGDIYICKTPRSAGFVILRNKSTMLKQ